MATYRFGAYTPSFPPGSPLHGRDGSAGVWLGADVGFTAMLDSSRSYWSFGDSYVGAAGSKARVGGAAGGVIGSTVGVGVCSGGVWSVAFRHGGSGGKFAPFFDDGLNGGLSARFAAQTPLVYGGKLYVLMPRIANAGTSFVPLSSHAARVNNPGADPSAWSIDYLTLAPSGPRDGTPAFGSEAFVYGSDLILYGNLPGKVVACAVPMGVLAAAPGGSDVSASVRRRDASGAWAPGLTGDDWWDCSIPTTAGFSARMDTALGAWVCVHTDTRVAGGFPPYASVMVSKGGPFGPWSGPKVLGYFPEMIADDPLYHPDNCCYAVREVTDFEPEPGRGSVRITYTVGSRSAMAGDEARQLADQAVYVVRSAVFPNPFA